MNLLPTVRRLAIDADQVISGMAMRQTLGEQLLKGRAVFDLDSIREAGTVVVDERNLHRGFR